MSQKSGQATKSSTVDPGFLPAAQALLPSKQRLVHSLSSPSFLPSDRNAKLIRIAEEVKRRSHAIRDDNFDLVSSHDLSLMAELYDEEFFGGHCLALARQEGLSFRWSRRMTSAGGKTTRTSSREKGTASKKVHYEITLSSTLLFQSFQDGNSVSKVCGLKCTNRMEAMQRVLEHELIHLFEMLVWVDSNCAATRFQSIANRLFGHTEHRHELVTQRERASKEFDIRLGSKVRFRFEGTIQFGVVNRITRRATVLVESPDGVLFSDGKRYRKYYVPISKLTRV